MPRGASYIAVAFLAVLGVTALVLAVNPNVSDRYRAYYIDRTTDCWPANTNGNLPTSGRIWFLNPDNVEVAKNVLECGWADTEPTGTWSSGRDVRLAIRPTGRGPWAVELDLLPFSGAGIPHQRLTITAKGERLLETELRRGEGMQHQLHLEPRHLEADGRAILEFSLPDAISPAELGLAPDRRKLALRLLSLKVSTTDQ
jgi:hypothetical protein